MTRDQRSNNSQYLRIFIKYSDFYSLWIILSFETK